jgi:hypothetical protein
MNCSQCQAANGPDAAFCANCGARLAPAEAPTGAAGYASAPSAPGAPGYGAEGTPAGYGSAGGSSAGYGTSGGYAAPPPPPAGYGPPSGAPTGYPQAQYGQAPGQDQYGQGQPQDQYGQGQYQPSGTGPYIPPSAGTPAAGFDLNRLSTVDRTVGIATLITMISLWLPWFTGHYSVLGETSSGTISGTGDHGWLWIEFILALLLLAYLVARANWEKLPFNLPVAHSTLLAAGTGVQFLLILLGFFALPSTDGIQGLSVSWDFGAFIALIASIVAAAPVIYPTAKSYLETRKGSGSQSY